MHFRKSAVLLCVMAIANSAHSQGLTTDAMSKIRQEAIELCGEFKLDGGGTEFEVGGKVELKARGFLSRLTDAGVEGAARINKDSYSNVLREKLADELQSNRDCRQEMFKFMVDQIGLSEPVTKPNAVTDIAGVWRYTGTCPNPYGFGTVQVYGDFEMRRQGGQWGGRAVSSLGLQAQFSTQVSGDVVTSHLQWSDGSYEVATGYLQAGGSIMSISDTAGCRTTAQKLN